MSEIKEFSELLKTRQSVRHYQSRPVSRELLGKLVEAVRLAPSASNSQPWKLIVVDDPELCTQVAQATFSATVNFNRFALEAPVIAVFVMETAGIITQVGAWLKKRQFSLVDIGIAAAHFCLQAAELGLGTCMLGWFDEKKVKRLLAIPAGRRIGLLVTLGYAAAGDQLREKSRKDASLMSAFNSY
ncbi:MAG: nitroreductase family protein [Candidatus Aminicenantes bacterium]|nr:nitroreductase family protein [Candidatus Aminicenantes bacterium]